VFTGIVETTVPIVDARGGPEGLALELDVGAELATALRIGASLAVDGCCLTVVRKSGTRLGFDVVPESLERTTFAVRKAGERVNVERGLAFGDRLDGHVVTGHVDGLCTVQRIEVRGDEWRLAFDLPAALRRYVVEKGSITIHGVSLTVAALTSTGCEVAVIPHTRAVTTLGQVRAGDRLHVEVDALAKWVDRLLAVPALASRP
jgi:riboflavin synthase